MVRDTSTNRGRAKEEDKPDKADHTHAYLIFLVSSLSLVCLTGLSVYNGYIGIRTDVDNDSTVKILSIIITCCVFGIVCISNVSDETINKAYLFLGAITAAVLFTPQI